MKEKAKEQTEKVQNQRQVEGAAEHGQQCQTLPTCKGWEVTLDGQQGAIWHTD